MEWISLFNVYFVCITDVNLFMFNNEGLRVRQGHCDAKRSEKIGKDEEWKSWSSPKPLGDSPSEPPVCQTF